MISQMMIESHFCQIEKPNDQVDQRENVYIFIYLYLYDIIHRRLMGKNPNRSWSAIFLQALGVRLRDPLTRPSAYQSNGNNNNVSLGTQPKPGRSKSKDVCWICNKGRCSYGQNCRFEHKCANCNRPRHPSSQYRKEKNNKEKDKTN